MEFVSDQSPEAADLIKPFIDGHTASRAKAQPKQFTHAKLINNNSHSQKETLHREAQLDVEDLAYWAANRSEAPTAELLEFKTTAPHPSPNHISKNGPYLNRAQRRHLARTRAAAKSTL